MVREFNLINELGQTYSLMDIENYSLLTSPSGLGYSYETEYEQIGNTFITSLRKLTQGSIYAQLNFKKYDNYKNLVDFLEKSETIRFEYIVPYKSGEKTFYRDIELQELTKSELQNTNGILSENVTFNCKSLWYEMVNKKYEIDPNANEVRWDFYNDAYWSGYEVRDMDYINDGHIDSPIEVTINGEVTNPSIELYVEGELVKTMAVTGTIAEYEKLLYSSREGDFYIKRQNTDGTYTSLFSLDYISFENDNVIRIPPRRDCSVKLQADSDIESASITIYVYYKAV